jgi:hypothetical protein
LFPFSFSQAIGVELVVEMRPFLGCCGVVSMLIFEPREISEKDEIILCCKEHAF